MRKLGVVFSILVMTSLMFVSSCVTRQIPVTETYFETEYKTEYRIETYSETVNAVIDSRQGKTYLNPQVKWYTDLLVPGFEGSGGTYYYGYHIDPSVHSKNQVEVRISQTAQEQSGIVRVYDLTGIGQIPPRPTPYKKFWYEPSEVDWLNRLNAVLSTAHQFGEVRLGTGVVTEAQIVFDANGVIEFGIFATTWNAYAIRSVRLVWIDEVMGQKTITGEKQIPYQVSYQVEKQRTVYKTETVPFWDALSAR